MRRIKLMRSYLIKNYLRTKALWRTIQFLIGFKTKVLNKTKALLKVIKVQNLKLMTLTKIL